MKIVCNQSNFWKHAARLLGNDCSPETVAALRVAIFNGFERLPGHISHSRQAHLEKIDKALGTHGVEGLLLDDEGNDVSGSCDPSRVAVDVQYCNAGDTYALTILYVNGRLCIGDWGSIVEMLDPVNR